MNWFIHFISFFSLHLLWSPGVYQIRQALSWVECKLDSFDENICTINNLFHNTYPIGRLSKRIDSFWWRHKHNQTHKYQPKPYVLWQYWLLKTRRFRVIWTNYSCRTVYLLVYLNWNLCCFYSSNHTTREREEKKHESISNDIYRNDYVWKKKYLHLARLICWNLNNLVRFCTWKYLSCCAHRIRRKIKRSWGIACQHNFSFMSV